VIDPKDIPVQARDELRLTSNHRINFEVPINPLQHGSKELGNGFYHLRPTRFYFNKL
jgi:hypothetical protein